ncbi:MAG: DUF6265 family protein [Thermoanaerobaculales bacterium]|jgi:hypothetical protein|nr:DUF6265 family protein [Thermoanaerobaculales bacterium]
MRSSALVVVAGMVASVAFVVGSQDAPPELALDELAWLAGHWRGSADGVITEELWLAPAGGLMLGLHRDLPPGRPAAFEYLRIEVRGHGAVYLASPGGGAVTEFPLVASGPMEAVFENPGHDFPQRIIYRREGDTLVARIEGEVDGRQRSAQWEWRLES